MNFSALKVQFTMVDHGEVAINQLCGRNRTKPPKFKPDHVSDPKSSEPVWIQFTPGKTGKSGTTTPGVWFTTEPYSSIEYVSRGTYAYFDNRVTFEMMMRKETIKNIQIWEALKVWALEILAAERKI